jgi:hypothetical protein
MHLQYRPWTGTPRRPAWSVLPIARVALGLLFRRKLFWILYSCALFLFLMFFFGSLLLDWVQSQLTDVPIQIGKLKIEPSKAMEFIRGQIRVLSGSRATYAYFFQFQGAITVIVLTLSGAMLVGNDFAQRSVPFYLAKPIRGRHYVLGKFLAAGVVVNLLTTLPALLLYVQHVSSNWDYLLDPDFFRRTGGQGPGGIPLLLGVLGHGLILTVVLGILLVTTAAWVQRTVPLILVWSSLFLFLRALAAVLVNRLQWNAHWRLLDIWNSMGLLGMWCLGFEHHEIDPDPQPSFAAAAAFLTVGCVLCLIWLRRRLHRLEVVRSS